MKTITRWADGTFGAVETPPWWDDEMNRLWPENLSIPHDAEVIRYGERHGQEISVFSLLDGRGFVLSLDTPVAAFLVWAPTEAAMLDFMTSRAAAWHGLGEGRPLAESLDHIRNAVVSIARHGIGSESISLWSGVHKRDET